MCKNRVGTKVVGAEVVVGVGSNVVNTVVGSDVVVNKVEVESPNIVTVVGSDIGNDVVEVVGSNVVWYNTYH